MSLRFDASGESLSLAFANLWTNEGPFTAAAMVRVSSFTASVYQTIFGLHDTGVNYALVQDNGDTSGTIKFWNRDAPASELSITGPTIGTSQWWFFAVTVNSAENTAHFYAARHNVDSALTDYSSGGALYDPIFADSPNFYVGSSGVTSEFLNGDIAWLKIWERELSSAQLLNEFFAGPNIYDSTSIFGFYKLDTVSGNDDSGNGNHLTVNGSPTVQSDPTGPAPVSFVATLDGSNVNFGWTNKDNGIYRKQIWWWKPGEDPATDDGVSIGTYPGSENNPIEPAPSQVGVHTYVVAIIDATDAIIGYSSQDTITVGGTATLEQEGFRFRNDDGNETGATWKASQDVNISLAVGDKFRLRFIIDAVNDPASTGFILQAKKSTDATWKNVPVKP